jgi:hypothetical protein
VSILKSNELVAPRPAPDGTHRPAGIFIGYGPSFGKGERLAPLEIVDVAPLMLNLLGVPVPSDLEGRVPTEALLGERAVCRGGDTRVLAHHEAVRAEPTEEEREALMNQLKVLGYMD